MSIKPVDMQVILPQATDVGKFQAVQNDKSMISQQLFAEKLQKEAAQRQEQVQETERGEFGKVNREQEREKREKNKKKPQAKTAQAKTENDHGKAGNKRQPQNLDPLLGTNLDISF